MKLIQFRFADREPNIGVVSDGRVFDTALVENPPDDLAMLIRRWDYYEPALQDAIKEIVAADDTASHPLVYAYDDVELLPPVTQQGAIICAAMNYSAPDAAPEDRPEYPVLFLKDRHTIHPPHVAIILPSVSDKVFCEGELAVVIGRGGKHIPVDKALDHIFGCTIANDVGAHDLERRSSQWTTGKLPDTFLPIGPALVTFSDIANVNDLTIHVSINDKPYLVGHTGDMIFGIADLIAYISSFKTLAPGDLIVTGSPKSLGSRPAAVQYLKPGDSITITIDPIGKLTNPVQDEERYNA